VIIPTGDPDSLRHVAEDEWTPEVADSLVRDACAQAAVPYAEHSLVRFGSNAVYRILPGPVLLRIAPPGTDEIRWIQQIAIVEWLAEQGCPVNRPRASQVERLPGGALAAFWEWFNCDPGARPSPHHFGELLRCIHDALRRCDLPAGQWDGLTRVRARLASANADGHLDDDDYGLLTDWANRLDNSVSRADAGLGIGLIHGDAHTGNTLSKDGYTVMIDFDGIATGPRVWDLVPMAVSVARFGAPPEHLDQLLDGYGCDPRASPEWQSFVRLRELYVTAWLVGVRGGERTNREIAHRLDCWRSGDEAQHWNPL
jgi:Ser/Thr protein kinase RdoA (MazF antagonist)